MGDLSFVIFRLSFVILGKGNSPPDPFCLFLKQFGIFTVLLCEPDVPGERL